MVKQFSESLFRLSLINEGLFSIIYYYIAMWNPE